MMDDSKSKAFYNRDDTVRMRFDRITMENAEGGGINVTFFYGDMELCSAITRGASFEKDDMVLNLGGIEASMQVEFSR
jgi:hypothetical protein